jgi:CBS domain-containing protein
VRPGTSCELRADLEGFRVSAQVLVVRCTASGTAPDGAGGRELVYHAGARILQVEDPSRRDFESWLADLLTALNETSGGVDVEATLNEPAAMETSGDEAPASASLMLTARDVMSVPVYTIRDDQTLEDLAALLVEFEIPGAPVVSGEGKLVGVVTAGDFMMHRDGAERGRKYVRGKSKPKRKLVRDVMTTPELRTVPEDLMLPELIRTMVARRAGRLLVVRGDEVVGIVNAVDLLDIPNPSAGAVEIEVLVAD